MSKFFQNFEIKNKKIKSESLSSSIIIKNCLFKEKKKVLSPTIFLKSIKPDKKNQKISHRLYIMESILAIVVKTYYNNEYELENNLLEILKLTEQIKISKKKSNINKKNRKISINSNGGTKTEKGGDKDDPCKIGKINILDYLISPLKKDFEFELWSIKQIAIFECSICVFGKRFDLIESMVVGKNIDQVIMFYNFWKFTSHYRTWKKYQKKLSLNYSRIWH